MNRNCEKHFEEMQSVLSERDNEIAELRAELAAVKAERDARYTREQVAQAVRLEWGKAIPLDAILNALDAGRVK